MQDTLDRVSDWARERIQAGQEPPWTYYKLMQLIDALEGLRADSAITPQMESLLRSPERSDSVRPQEAQIVDLDMLRRPPADPSGLARK